MRPSDARSAPRVHAQRGRGPGRRSPALRGSALGLCALGAVGCTQPPPRSQFPSADDALARMHAGFECAVGVQGTAKVDLVSKQGRVKGEVDLFAINPDKVRFDVASPFGVMIYSLTSDGQDFKFADMEQKTFFYGPANTCNLARFTQVPVPPHALVSLLRGEAPVLTHDKSTARIRWDGDGFYELSIDSKHEATQTIQLEVVPEDLDKEWSAQRVRLKRVVVSQAGSALYAADLSRFEPIKTAPARVDEDGVDDPIPPSGPECNAEVPRTIRFRVPDTKDDVVFDYKDAKWNPPLIEGTFTQPVPGGMRKQYTSCPGDEAPPVLPVPPAPTP